MAYFFGDSFDLYSAIADCGTYWDAALGSITLAISSVGRFAGSRGLSIAAANAGPCLVKTSNVNDAVHHISVSAQQTSTLTGASSGFFFIFYDGSTAQCSLVFTSSGLLILTSGPPTGTTLATYSGAIAATSVWYQFEIEVVISNTAGSIAVRRNGNISNDFFLGSLNTRVSANNYANKIGVGANWVTGTQNIDDFLWRSDASSLAWLGDIRCYTRMPASDVSAQWSQSGPPITQVLFTNQGNPNSTTNMAVYTPFISRVSGPIGSVIVGIATGGTISIKCALFASSGGNPTTVLGTATNIVTSAAAGSYNTFTFSPAVTVVAGTQYFVGICFSGNQANCYMASNSGTSGLTGTGVAYASWPTASPSALSATFASASSVVFSSSTNAGYVAEAQQDGATTYVYSSTVGQSDLYGITSLSATPGAIVGVVTRAYEQKTDAGTRIVKLQLQSGAANAQTPGLVLNAGQWQWDYRTDLVDPATGAAWTAVGVNNAQVGVVVTT